MKLDSRIFPGKQPLTCFDVELAKDFIGKECYFSNSSKKYEDLKEIEKSTGTSIYCRKGVLAGVYTEGQEVAFLDDINAEFRYCLPCDWVEQELTFRPYTVMEFIKEYPIGTHLRFRSKDNTMEMHRLIDGYNDCKNGAGTLFMSGVMFSMQELFNNYEIFKDGNWEPFGKILE